MPDYDVLAPHYDALTGDVSDEAAFIRQNIERRCSGAVTLLDIACGTGGITAVLAGAFRVSALDISPGMLAVARERLSPGTPLYQADMRSFDLDAKFDAIVCSYQAVNHLLDFPSWKDFFGCVHRHLNDGGLFLFDIATISYLTMAANSPRTVRKFDDNYLRRKVTNTGEGTFQWRIEVFELQRDGRYKVLREILRMRSFPLGDIGHALGGQGFINVEALDRQGNPAGDQNEARTWFVCGKPVRPDSAQSLVPSSFI